MYLSDAALAAAKEVQQTFAEEWKKTGRVPGTWVHWAACHSRVFLSQYRSLYIFSTIPTEKKNSAFKLDLGHLFRGWSITRPIYTRRGLLHLVNSHALDLGLLLRRAQREGREIQLKKRRRMPSAEGEQLMTTPPPHDSCKPKTWGWWPFHFHLCCLSSAPVYGVHSSDLDMITALMQQPLADGAGAVARS